MDRRIKLARSKKKAKLENKYIFLDCFATWCSPCKKMDKDVYTNNKVGDFINDKFISVKVQMDKTKNDNAVTQSWYEDVAEINKHYFITGYPSFIFFSPTGTIVHKETGFREIEKFIALAQTALTPGKAWNDEYSEYVKLISEYKGGNVKYNKLPFMIAVAKKSRDSMIRQLVRLHESHVSSLPANQRYTKENIILWSTLNLTSDRKIIQFFFRDSDQIDRVMQKKGYAHAQVDKCIQNFTTMPFINMQLKNQDARSGASIYNTVTGVMISNKTNYDEADWTKLYQIIEKEFNKSCAQRNVQKAKVIWYKMNSNWDAYARTSFELFKSTPPTLSELLDFANLNELCWSVFLNVNDKKLITEAAKWMGNLVKNVKPENTNFPNYLDTYANLLYKSGQKELAIQWEGKALNLTMPGSPKNKWYNEALEQMKKDEPTYGLKW